jgi:hypothetical protein
MQIGDLIKMKYCTWWKLRQRKKFTKQAGIVVGIAGQGIKVRMPDGSLVMGLAEHWEVLNEAR